MPAEARMQRESTRRQGRGGRRKTAGKTADSVRRLMVAGRGASVSRTAGQHDDAEKAGDARHAKAGKAAGRPRLSDFVPPRDNGRRQWRRKGRLPSGQTLCPDEEGPHDAQDARRIMGKGEDDVRQRNDGNAAHKPDECRGVVHAAS